MRLAVILSCSLAIALPAFGSDPNGCASRANDSDTACVGAQHAASDATAPAPVQQPVSDWVPREQLAPDLAAGLPQYCDGAYVEPPHAVPLDVDPATLPIQLSAENLQYQVGDLAVLDGGVTATRGNQSVTTPHATFHVPDRTVDADAGLTLREPGLLATGASGEVALSTGAATINDARFELHDEKLRGSAAALERTAEGDLIARRASVTRCDPGNNDWRLTAKEVRIDDGARYGVVRDAVLRVKGVPVLYTPFIRFPVTDERATGWLFPDFGYSNKDGTDIAAPYYLNLAPNYDLTLTPRNISDRGTGMQADFNHLSRYGRSELAGALLYHDHEYNGSYSRDQFNQLGLPGSFEPANRWLVLANQRAAIGDFSTLVDYTKVSDLDYFRDLGTDLSVASQVDLNQTGELMYRHGGASLMLWAQDFQPLDSYGPEPYQRLPGVDFAYQGRLAGPLQWSLATTWADFDRPNGTLTGIDRINGKRLYVEPRVLLPLDAPYGFLHFVGGYRYTEYDLSDVPLGSTQHPERKIWMGSVDGGLTFRRELGSGAVQTLEPRLFYLYQQYRNQNALPQFDVAELEFTFDQLFRDNRFAGLDRIADANQLTAALTSRLLDGRTGAERLRVSIGRIVYFEDRQVTLSGSPSNADNHSGSPLAGAFDVILGGGFKLLSSATYDSTDSDWNEVTAALQYAPDGRHIVNLGYRRRTDYAPVVKQSDVSAYWTLARNWSWIGRFDYDLEEKRTIDAMAGLEYSDCCWQIRLVGRRFLSQPGNATTSDPKSDKGIYLQIVFKGLAGLGGRIDSLMESGIPGYRAEAY